MVQFRRIVCATDFSPTAAVAVGQATELARQQGGEVVLVHVLPHLAQPFGGMGMIDSLGTLQAELRDRAREQLAAVGKQFGNGLRLRTELREGHIAEQVLACARDTNADLIVLGTHGHTGLQHVLLGSTAERVVRLAPCPVLTIRSSPS